MPYQLTYRLKASREIREADIHNILEASEKNNRQLGITGCLIFKAPFFIQILEGEQETVLKIYDSIEQDDRHEEVEILHQEECNERIFREWRMAFSDVDKDVRWRQEENLKTEIGLLAKPGVPSFVFRVFWYTVGQLLERKGLYRVPDEQKA